MGEAMKQIHGMHSVTIRAAAQMASGGPQIERLHAHGHSYAAQRQSQIKRARDTSIEEESMD